MAFREENGRWLEDYALYMACKRHFGMKSWTEWPDTALRLRKSPEVLEQYHTKLQEDVELFIYIQFLFFRQWTALREYLHQQDIQVIGDLPIYVPMDSADVWAEPEFFQLDDQCIPTAVSGVPPDYFSEDGQLWGTPLYRWDVMQEDGFGWWIRRIDGAGKLRRIWHIDIPGILPTIAILLIMRFGQMMSLGFDKAYIMQNSLNYSVSEVLSTYIYKQGIKSTKYSYSAAISLFNNLINLIMLVTVNRISDKLSGNSLF